MKWLIFILLIPTAKADALLDAMMTDWASIQIEVSEMENDPVYSDREITDNYEVEIYHWRLGTPDNIPEIEIIYDDPSPCGL